MRVVKPYPMALWNDPQNSRTGCTSIQNKYHHMPRFDAKRVKMNNLQLYGNDFVKSARNKMTAPKSMVVVTNPIPW